MGQYDVVVVGLGVMGAAASWAASKRGARVLGVDARQAGHALGSSHGKTRATRESYFESPDYVPLMKEAHRLWRILEREALTDLLNLNGGAYLGPPDHPVMAGVRRAAAAHDLALEVYSPVEMMARHPGFRVPGNWQALVERTAGVLRAEACLKAFHDVARSAGAELRFGVEALDWRAHADGVIVDLASGSVATRKLILALGPWSVGGLGLDLPIHGRRVTVAHFDTAQPNDYADEDIGTFFWASDLGVFGGFQHIDGQGVKLLRHDEGGPCTPETIQREVTDQDIRAFIDFAAVHLPGVGSKLREAYTCIYTMTPDDHFILDRHPASRDIVYATGFSGHGFKFAPVIGEILADLSLSGETKREIGFLRAARFQGG